MFRLQTTSVIDQRPAQVSPLLTDLLPCRVLDPSRTQGCGEKCDLKKRETHAIVGGVCAQNVVAFLSAFSPPQPEVPLSAPSGPRKADARAPDSPTSSEEPATPFFQRCEVMFTFARKSDGTHSGTSCRAFVQLQKDAFAFAFVGGFVVESRGLRSCLFPSAAKED